MVSEFQRKYAHFNPVTADIALQREMEVANEKFVAALRAYFRQREARSVAVRN